jgi:hypothetical protein
MQMNRKELEAFTKEAAKGIKTPQDLNDFSRMLKKITVEAALNVQMDEHQANDYGSFLVLFQQCAHSFLTLRSLIFLRLLQMFKNR